MKITFKITNLAQFTMQMMGYAAQIDNESENTAMEVGKRVLEKSNEYAPEDTGYMKSTGFVRKAR
jgi:hypothetical protein